MNFLRKSSMILLGAATAGLLAFACADNDGIAGDSSEINASSSRATDIVISQVYGGGGDGSSKPGDFVELFNPTKAPIKLSGLVLQTQLRKKTGFDKTKLIDLGDATIEAGHYFLVSFSAGKTFGADKKQPDLEIKDHGGDFIVGGGAVALVAKDTPCNEGCTDATPARDIVGYGYADEAKTMPEQHLSNLAPTPASGEQAVLRLGNGCYDSGMNEVDFSASSAPTPRTSAISFDCDLLFPAAKPDAGDPDVDASDSDGGSADASAPKDSGTTTPKDGGTVKKDGGTVKKDAGTTTPTTGDDDNGDDDSDTTPPAATGTKKKVSSANAPPQPIAASSPSCSTSSGPASAGGFAGLAGIGLALSALGRRRNRNK